MIFKNVYLDLLSKTTKLDTLDSLPKENKWEE